MTGEGLRRLAASFSRAAPAYDAMAQVQRALRRHLLAALPPGPYRRVLDIGCGTGALTWELKRHWPRASVVGLDIARGMLGEAAASAPAPGPRLVLADGAAPLPFAPGVFDLVASSGMFQWVGWAGGQGAAGEALAGWASVMARGGLLALAAFGPGTLRELSAALDAAGLDGALPASRFMGGQEVAAAAGEAGLRVVVLREFSIQRSYGSVVEILRSLKGAGVVPGTGRPALRGRGHLRRLESAYLRLFGGVEATYDLYLILGRRD